MEYKFDVSIIVLTYFHEEFLEKAIQSILKQNTDFSYEILISDDASTDGTIRIAEKLKNKYPDLISIHSYANNIGTTRNLYEALLRSNGKYITLLAGDDYYCDENKLMLQKEYLDKHKDCFAVGVTTKSEFTNGESTGELIPSQKYRDRDFLLTDFEKGNNYPLHGIMFRNLLSDDNIRNKFYICVEFSKYIEDLTLCLIFFEFGKVHILSAIAYSITIRSKNDKNQHNFNSLYGGKQSMIMHVDLLKKLYKYFYKIDLRDRLGDVCWGIICIAIKEHNFHYLKHLKGVNMLLILRGAINWLKKKLGV